MAPQKISGGRGGSAREIRFSELLQALWGPTESNATHFDK